MVTYMWVVNIVSGNHLLPDGTKPIAGPVLAFTVGLYVIHLRAVINSLRPGDASVSFTWEQ